MNAIRQRDRCRYPLTEEDESTRLNVPSLMNRWFDSTLSSLLLACNDYLSFTDRVNYPVSRPCYPNPESAFI